MLSRLVDQGLHLPWINLFLTPFSCLANNGHFYDFKKSELWYENSRKADDLETHPFEL